MFSSNKIRIFTEKKAYAPGETIKGVLIADVSYRQHIKDIIVSIKGFETVNVFNYYYVGMENSHKNDITLDHTEQLKKVDGYIRKGRYNIPFSIELPYCLPSSFPLTTINNTTFGEIQYVLSAKVETMDYFSFNWTDEVIITIFNRTNINETTSYLSQSDNSVTSMCCVKNGTYDYYMLLDKNIYGPGDVITGVLEVTSNSESDLMCSIALKRVITFSTSLTKYTTSIVCKTSLAPVPAGQKMNQRFSLKIPEKNIISNFRDEHIKCEYYLVYCIGSSYFESYKKGIFFTIKHPCEMLSSLPVLDLDMVINKGSVYINAENYDMKI